MDSLIEVVVTEKVLEKYPMHDWGKTCTLIAKNNTLKGELPATLCRSVV